MRCPYCATDDDRVVDSRPAERGAAIRRRRECRSCGQRFSTFERVEQAALSVRKRDGRVEPYDRTKVLSGIAKATNLAGDAEAVVRAAAQVEARVRARGARIVDSDDVGSEVLDVLRALDPVAYVRFASVHKDFTSPEDFREELAALARPHERPRGSSGQPPQQPPGPSR